MKDFFKRIKLKMAKWVLPWIASVVTSLPYTDKRSLFIDRLIVLSEN